MTSPELMARAYAQRALLLKDPANKRVELGLLGDTVVLKVSRSEAE